MDTTGPAPIALLPPPSGMGRDATQSGQTAGRRFQTQEGAEARTSFADAATEAPAAADEGFDAARPVGSARRRRQGTFAAEGFRLLQDLASRIGLTLEPWAVGIAAYQRAASLPTTAPPRRILDLFA